MLIFSACATRTFSEKVENAESCIFYESKFYFANFENEGAFINSYDSKRWTRYFVEGLERPKGIAAFEGFLLINDQTLIHIYSLQRKRIVKTLKVPGAISLNDIAIDKKGNFFSADSKAQIIFAGHISSPLVTPYFNVDFIPNGLLIDGDNLLISSWGREMDENWNTLHRGKLWKYSFGDNKLNPFHPKELGYLDGIAKLSENKYLVSAKRENRLYIFEKDKEPRVHSSALGPADIGVSNSMVCIPSYSHEKVEIREL